MSINYSLCACIKIFLVCSSTYLVPQWLLVFFLPITITVYILALATDHWVAEIFVSSTLSPLQNMCTMWYCLYIIIVSRLISFCMLHVLNLVYDLSMFYIQLYENSTLYFSENTLTLVCTLNNSLMESPVSV